MVKELILYCRLEQVGHDKMWSLIALFLANLENKLLNETNGFYPKLYLRYVDDVFAIFDDNLTIKKFLNLCK